jgi:hypothetical protein
MVEPQKPTPRPATGPGFFQGAWTYRSFLNHADISVEPNELLFGRATIELAEAGDGRITGTIGGEGWSLALEGDASYHPGGASVRLQGTGTLGGEPWVYDYFGFALPGWSNGVGQVPGIAGTIVRTVAHHGGQAKAGDTATFYAVRQGA